MQITDVKVRKVLNEGRMKAVVSVTFDNSFVVHDIKVVEGKSGLFVAMPSRRRPNGDFRDVAHPITPDARRQLEEAVLSAYNNALQQVGPS